MDSPHSVTSDFLKSLDIGLIKVALGSGDAFNLKRVLFVVIWGLLLLSLDLCALSVKVAISCQR